MTNTQDAKEKVCLIDGSGYIFRAFFASPQMTNPEGLPVNAVYGFLNMFLSLTANIKCDYCLVLFDAKRQNFRNEFFPEYKATRPELPPELKPQFALIHEAVEALNLHWLQMEGYEADDLIATYADLALKEGKDVTIVSADKDLMQLIRPGVEFYDGMKNKFFTPEDVKEKFGVYPERVTDVQALAGDSTDNIPGIPGIGLKTAAELVNMFGSLEGVLEHAAEIKQNKRRELVMAHKEDALVSQKLVTLKPDVPVELPLKDLRCMAPHQDVLISLLDRHAFKSLKNKALNWLKQRCSDLPEEADAAPVYKPVYTLFKPRRNLMRSPPPFAPKTLLPLRYIPPAKNSSDCRSACKTLMPVIFPLPTRKPHLRPLQQTCSAEICSHPRPLAPRPLRGAALPPACPSPALKNLSGACSPTRPSLKYP